MCYSFWGNFMIKQILTFVNFKARCIRINIQQFLGSSRISEMLESFKFWQVHWISHQGGFFSLLILNSLNQILSNIGEPVMKQPIRICISFFLAANRKETELSGSWGERSIAQRSDRNACQTRDQHISLFGGQFSKLHSREMGRIWLSPCYLLLEKLVYLKM